MIAHDWPPADTTTVSQPCTCHRTTTGERCEAVWHATSPPSEPVPRNRDSAARNWR
jgi:hypothetical protein